MPEQEAFERRLRAAMLRYVADGPTTFDALEFARAVASAEPRQHGLAAAIAAAARTMSGRGRRRWWSALVPPGSSSRVVRVAWIVALVALLLAATAAGVYVGGELLRRTIEPSDLRPPTLTLTLARPGELTAITWSPDGTHVATGSRWLEGNRDSQWERSMATIWDPSTGDEVLVLEQVDARVDRIAYSPDGTRLAIGGFAPAVYDAATGLELPGKLSEFLAWSPDGTRIAAGGAWGWAAILDATTGDVQLEFPLSSSWMWDAAWSPDGSRLATTYGASVRIWDTTIGAEALRLQGYVYGDGYVKLEDIEWSPDGTRIAAVGATGNLKIWDAASGVRRSVLEGHTAIAWSPDGTRIAAVGHDGNATVWDARTGDELTVMGGHAGGVTDIAWSPDGTRIATAGRDGTARVWTLRSSGNRDSEGVAGGTIERPGGDGR